MFAGKTGSSQVKRFTQEIEREEIKQKDLKYEDRDHALYIAFAPYINPKYAISKYMEDQEVAAAPIAKKIIKKVLERDDLRNSQIYRNEKKFNVLV